jgi:Zn-dependent peptidase ImmA (M78 family)
MRRGFKTQAEAIAMELRGEMGLSAHDRIDCTALASHLAIQVVPVTALIGAGATAADVNCMVSDDMGFSAMTVYRGTKCKIFYNPFHAETRTANSVAHEVSHVVLEHEPGPVLTAKGTRDWNQAQEDEADWLAGAILVPRQGALRWLAHGGSMTGGAAHFGVSAQVFGWRANHTGVVTQLRRRAA